MATMPAPDKGAPTDEQAVRHAKTDALSDHAFEQLYSGATQVSDPYYRQQCQFAVLVLGRCGLRAGELAHIDESWIDWRRSRINIPRHDPCDKGRGGGMCGYCDQQREQMLRHNPGMSEATAASRMWQAKTDASARGVPFDFSARTELVVEDFFEQFRQWPLSRQGVNRRINRAAETSTGVTTDEIYPHALRATAATWHAGRGLSVLPLQSMFGWAQLSTAEKYLAASDDNTARAVRSTHSR